MLDGVGGGGVGWECDVVDFVVGGWVTGWVLVGGGCWGGWVIVVEVPPDDEMMMTVGAPGCEPTLVETVIPGGRVTGIVLPLLSVGSGRPGIEG